MALISIDGVLNGILDLTDPLIQRRLGTNTTELAGPWLPMQSRSLKGQAPPPPTQRLGRAAYESTAVVGFCYESARSLGQGGEPAYYGKAIAVFIDRLANDQHNWLEVYSRHSALKQRLP